MNNVLFVGVF